MEAKHAMLIFGRIQARYPNWIGGLAPEEQAATRGEWVEALGEFAELDEGWVWGKVLECLKSTPGNFPPGIDILCAFIRRADYAAARDKRIEQERRKMLEDRRERTVGPSDAAKECFEAVGALFEDMGVGNPLLTAAEILGKEPPTEEDWANMPELPGRDDT